MRTKRHQNNYQRLAKALKAAGYIVEEHTEHAMFFSYPDYKWWSVKGKGIVAAFSVPSIGTYKVLSGKIAAENDKCFDKWSKAPLVMKIKNIDINVLLKHLEFLGSEEGYRISNGFLYPEEYPFPYERED